MKCPSCGKVIRTKDVKYCPYCGLELESGKKPESNDNGLNNEDSQANRRRVFCLVGSFVLTIVLLGILFITLYSSALGNHKNFFYNYKDNLDKAISEYYENENTDKVIDVLDHLSDDVDNVFKVQDAAYDMIKSKIDRILEEEYDNLDSFDKEISKCKEKENKLYETVSSKNNDLHIISLDKHKELNEYMDKIFNDVKVYYEALDYFNDKDYNRSYQSFLEVKEDNICYDKVKKYKELIFDNIINLIKNDTMKLEIGISELSNKEMLQRYKQIESVILKYPEIYHEVPLKTNTNYQAILDKYHEKVEEYEEIVQNEN